LVYQVSPCAPGLRERFTNANCATVLGQIAFQTPTGEQTGILAACRNHHQSSGFGVCGSRGVYHRGKHHRASCLTLAVK
jgi:hypothetical protein